jgi:hypothetical protein
MPTLVPRICLISPHPLTSQDPDVGDETSLVEPHDDELSETGCTEVCDREWNDEQLMDDARPGRRRAASEANKCDSEANRYARKSQNKGCLFI